MFGILAVQLLLQLGQAIFFSKVANIQSAVFTIYRFQKVLEDFQNRIMLHYFIPHVDNAIIINGDIVCLAVTVLQHIEEVTNRPTRSPPRQICII
jgi:hypothetical protein